MKLFVTLLSFCIAWDTAFSFGVPDGLSLLQDDSGIETDSMDKSLQNNLKFASITLARRTYQPVTIRASGLYIGTEFAFVRVPPKIESGALNSVVKQYLFVPMPMLSVDYSSGSWQDNYSFFYGTTSPVPNSKMSYLSARIGRDLFIDSKKFWIVGLRMMYTSFFGERSIELLDQTTQQEFGLVGYGGELIVAMDFGGREATSNSRFAKFGIVPQFSVGTMDITSEFRADLIDTFVRYENQVPYLGAGVSMCSATRETCVALNTYFDKESGIIPSLMFLGKF